MHITAINNFILFYKFNQRDCFGCCPLPKSNNGQDLFIKNSQISFEANTSAGNQLKKLKNVPCPYYGVKMLQGAVMSKIELKLDKAPTIGKSVEILSKYSDYMLPVEKKIFERFKEYAKFHPDKTIPEYLQEIYDDSMTKLKLEEFSVLDDVDTLSKGLTPENALKLRKKITRCRSIILENNKLDTFKRKTLLNSLDEINPLPEETELFEKIKDRALYLPTSGSSENAFVVKYALRTHQEIAKRILKASVATIEHIKPDSLGGENKMSNFLLASSAANSYRSNMPLVKYIERFPDIPANCQKYINKIIKEINCKRLRGCETYPYDVKRTLEKESEGKIVLDIDKYKYTEARAQKRVTRHSKKK